MSCCQIHGLNSRVAQIIIITIIIVTIIIVIIIIVIIIITIIMMTNVQEAVSKGEAVPMKALQDLRHALVFSSSLSSTGAATTIIVIIADEVASE